ncbi:MAG: DUF7507 domain-containing protein [Clostridium sp.]
MDNLQVNENIIMEYSPKLMALKRVNRSVVKIGDIFKYTIEITNIGNVEIQKITVIDILPNVFAIQNIKLDGNIITGNLSTGLNIGDIQIGEIKTLVLDIKVISNLTTIFNNEVLVNGEAVVNNIGEVVEVSEYGIEPIGVKIVNPKLTLTKSADSDYAIVGDIVTYKILVSNTSDIDLSNIIISDLLSPELEFIEKSVTINGITYPTEIITSGVNIGDIFIGQNKEISFKVKIIGSSLKEIVNISTANYDFNLDGTLIQSGNANSNEVIINVEEANVNVIKTVDKEKVSLGDILNYKVELTNDGTLDALNVIFKDKLPQALEIVNGSFRVNNNVINSVNLEKGVNIGNIPIRTTTVVEYQSKVVAGTCTGNIINEARVSFKYALPDGITLGKETIPNSESSTLVAVNLTTFKQISVDEYLSIPQQKPEMEGINNITATVDILSSHVIMTPKDKSYESQNLTGYKLIVHGVLNQVVEYTALDQVQSVHAAHYNVPFSSFIILPDNFAVGSKIEVEGIVEDVYYKENDCRTFFKNVTVLLVAKIVLCDV